MDDLNCRKNPIHVSRDAGYKKFESISPVNRKEAEERLDNSDIVTRIELLEELYSEVGVIVYPKRMTNWYAFR